MSYLWVMTPTFSPCDANSKIYNWWKYHKVCMCTFRAQNCHISFIWHLPINSSLVLWVNKKLQPTSQCCVGYYYVFPNRTQHLKRQVASSWWNWTKCPHCFMAKNASPEVDGNNLFYLHKRGFNPYSTATDTFNIGQKYIVSVYTCQLVGILWISIEFGLVHRYAQLMFYMEVSNAVIKKGEKHNFKYPKPLYIYCTCTCRRPNNPKTATKKWQQQHRNHNIWGFGSTQRHEMMKEFACQKILN